MFPEKNNQELEDALIISISELSIALEAEVLAKLIIRSRIRKNHDALKLAWERKMKEIGLDHDFGVAAVIEEKRSELVSVPEMHVGKQLDFLKSRISSDNLGKKVYDRLSRTEIEFVWQALNLFPDNIMKFQGLGVKARQEAEDIFRDKLGKDWEKINARINSHIQALLNLPPEKIDFPQLAAAYEVIKPHLTAEEHYLRDLFVLGYRDDFPWLRKSVLPASITALRDKLEKAIYALIGSSIVK